jgi:hypothetical protein
METRSNRPRPAGTAAPGGGERPPGGWEPGEPESRCTALVAARIWRTKKDLRNRLGYASN